MRFKITSAAGVDMGIYEAKTAEEALDAMARDAGYRDAAHADEVTGAPFCGTIEESPLHESDEDCTLEGDTCRTCGVYHGAPCSECGGRGFHNGACPEAE